MRNVLKKDRFRTLSHYLLEDTNSQVSGDSFISKRIWLLEDWH